MSDRGAETKIGKFEFKLIVFIVLQYLISLCWVRSRYWKPTLWLRQKKHDFTASDRIIYRQVRNRRFCVSNNANWTTSDIRNIFVSGCSYSWNSFPSNVIEKLANSLCPHVFNNFHVNVAKFQISTLWMPLAISLRSAYSFYMRRHHAYILQL